MLWTTCTVWSRRSGSWGSALPATGPASRNRWFDRSGRNFSPLGLIGLLLVCCSSAVAGTWLPFEAEDFIPTGGPPVTETSCGSAPLDHLSKLCPETNHIALVLGKLMRNLVPYNNPLSEVLRTSSQGSQTRPRFLKLRDDRTVSPSPQNCDSSSAYTSVSPLIYGLSTTRTGVILS